MNNQYKIILLLSILCILLFIIFYIRHKYKSNNNHIELVISRYNEDLEWLKEEPFNKYPSICYNKGKNQDFYKPKNMQVINIENVGRCDHTYIYHIVNNYNSLSKYTMFLPGSCNMENKKGKAIRWIKEFEEKRSPIFIGNKVEKGVKQELYNFQIDEWISSDVKNKNINPENKLQLHDIRPFGKWYEKHFGDKDIYYISYFGVIGADRDYILKTPRVKYIKFMEELNKHSNPEVGHYFERAWAAIFNIDKNCVIISLN